MSPRPSGYTLLEMIVVMGILAMATAVAAPPSYRMIRSWQEATQLEDVIQQLDRLPTRSRSIGEPIEATPDAPLDAIELPEQWKLDFKTPFYVQANGACSNAQATLTTTYQTVELEISAPFCRTRRLEP